MRKAWMLFLSILLILTFSACEGISDVTQNSTGVTVPNATEESNRVTAPNATEESNRVTVPDATKDSTGVTVPDVTEDSNRVTVPDVTDDSNRVIVPDIIDISLLDGKSVVSNMGLIPRVEYEYHDTIAKDNIITCIPAVGETISKGQKVTLVVSKGPNMIQSTDSYANWTYITYGVKDEWEFYNPYIVDNTLYIECYNVTFGTAMTWRDRYNEGSASGTASINDTFDKVVPVRVKYEKQSFSANESQSFTIKVPLDNLDVATPSDLYFRIGISANGQDTNLLFDFSMTW